MKPQLTKTQLAHVLAGIAATEHKTALRYLDGAPVRHTVRERLDLAKQQWADMTAAYAAAHAPKGANHAPA
jgi:uncharacterized protein involved in exopolysaccharide biosynthesis